VSSQFGATATASSPPGLSTVTRESVRPFFTHAETTPQELVPDASVQPAPRSQIMIETRSRVSTLANWTLIRLGKLG